MSRLKSAASLLFTLLLAAVPAAAGDWPQWRGVDRDGKAEGESLAQSWPEDGPPLLWQTGGLGDGFASVAVVGDRLYTTGDFPEGQSVVAVDLNSHQVLWKTPITDGPPKHGYGGSRCTPTVDGDQLFVIGSDGSVACLTTEGAVVWKKNFADAYGSGNQAWGYAESPLVDGDKVVFTPGAGDALMVACDRNTGAERWRTPYPNLDTGKQEAGYSSMVVSEGGGVRQYVQMTGRGAVGVRAADGKLLWTYGAVANGVAVIPTPLVDGDRVFVSSGYGTGAALLNLKRDGDGVTAEEVYFLKANDFQNHHGQMILEDGHVYAGRGHNSGFPVCLELATGRIVWGEGERGPGKKSAAVVFADGLLVFRYQDGVVALIAATPERYDLRSVFRPAVNTDQPSWSHPAIAGGVMYLREQGTLMAYDVGNGK